MKLQNENSDYSVTLKKLQYDNAYIANDHQIYDKVQLINNYKRQQILDHRENTNTAFHNCHD